jgi:serine phosphatase RsbU (regulator of sigma subunit)
MLKDWLKNFSSLSAIEINYSILEQMMAFTNEKKIEDDYTILTLVVK